MNMNRTYIRPLYLLKHSGRHLGEGKGGQLPSIVSDLPNMIHNLLVVVHRTVTSQQTDMRLLFLKIWPTCNGQQIDKAIISCGVLA